MAARASPTARRPGAARADSRATPAAPPFPVCSCARSAPADPVRNQNLFPVTRCSMARNSACGPSRHKATGYRALHPAPVISRTRADADAHRHANNPHSLSRDVDDVNNKMIASYPVAGRRASLSSTAQARSPQQPAAVRQTRNPQSAPAPQQASCGSVAARPELSAGCRAARAIHVWVARRYYAGLGPVAHGRCRALHNNAPPPPVWRPHACLVPVSSRALHHNVHLPPGY
eukprot:scaffold4420_cov115-Isochrysis_galbana.AAC.5